jgi:hypothetical protein
MGTDQTKTAQALQIKERGLNKNKVCNLYVFVRTLFGRPDLYVLSATFKCSDLGSRLQICLLVEVVTL